MSKCGSEKCKTTCSSCEHKLPRIDMNEIRRIKKLIDESKNHNRKTCNCEGCKLWWMIPVKIHPSGMVYEIFPLAERKHTPLSFHHEQQIMLGLVIHKGLPIMNYVWFARNQLISSLI